MKKVLLSFFALMMMGKVSADVTISVDNVTLPQNGRTEMAINFSATGVDREGVIVMEKIQAYILNLQLPDGISLVSKNGEYAYTLGDCYPASPTFRVTIEDGIYRIGCNSTDVLTKNSGTLFTLTLQCDGEFSVGDVLTAQFTEVEVDGQNGNGVSNPIGEAGSDFYDSQIIANDFTITIGEPLTTVELDEDSEDAPVASDGKVNVHVQRTINANEWNTICLPFAMTATQVKEAFGDGVELGDFNNYVLYNAGEGGYSVKHIHVNFEPVTAMEANVPYIIRVENNMTEFTVNNVEIVALDEDEEFPVKRFGTVSGITYKPRDFYGSYVADFDFYGVWKARGVTPLFLSGNKFWYASEQTQHLKAFRGYFVFKDEAPDMDASANVLMVFNDGESTGISRVQAPVADGPYYNLNGQVVERPAKGLYIHNGKKVILK